MAFKRSAVRSRLSPPKTNQRLCPLVFLSRACGAARGSLRSAVRRGARPEGVSRLSPSKRNSHRKVAVFLLHDVTIKKDFTAKKIDLRDIVANKIIQSYSMTRHFSTPLKDELGAPLFTALLLKSVTDEMVMAKGADTNFIMLYPRRIICQIIYDQKAIDHLKFLNPNIQII